MFQDFEEEQRNKANRQAVFNDRNNLYNSHLVIDSQKIIDSVESAINLAKEEVVAQ